MKELTCIYDDKNQHKRFKQSFNSFLKYHKEYKKDMLIFPLRKNREKYYLYKFHLNKNVL